MSAINNAGEVVGFSADNAANPTLFTNFTRSSSGGFSLVNGFGDPFAMANGINDMRSVVGGLTGMRF